MEVSRKCNAILLQATVGVSIQKDGNYQAQKLEEYPIAKKVPISHISKRSFSSRRVSFFFFFGNDSGVSRHTHIHTIAC